MSIEKIVKKSREIFGTVKERNIATNKKKSLLIVDFGPNK